MPPGLLITWQGGKKRNMGGPTPGTARGEIKRIEERRSETAEGGAEEIKESKEVI